MDPLPILATLHRLQLPDGGLPELAGEHSRIDATAWGILALKFYEENTEVLNKGLSYLRSQQQTDGRLTIAPYAPEASWPTPVAILAWNPSEQFLDARDQAVHFLLNWSGSHWEPMNRAISSHNTAIVGWPWIANTHSWIIPTGMAILALKAAGKGTHARVREGQRMILDRQLPHGGWNYGNTLVFGKELRPLPECTGVALQALATDTHITMVERSLDYLLKIVTKLRTPVSLGWALIGLGAWGWFPHEADELVARSLSLQERYGPYPVTSLALLLCAAKARHGLQTLLSIPHVMKLS